MTWYQRARQVFALRKHAMRVDLHVHCGDVEDFNNPNDMDAQIKSVLTAAIIKGLDVVGVVGHGSPTVGWRALQVAQQNQIDLYVVPGEEYVCADKARVIVYKLRNSLPPNLPLEQVIAHTHQNGGLLMMINLTKRQAQWVNHTAGSESSPDMIEIYNAVIGGYQDHQIDAAIPAFISSAAKNATDMSQANVYTIVDRPDLESLGLIPQGQGEDYVPPYLRRDDEIQDGKSEQSVSEEPMSRSPANTAPAPSSTTAPVPAPNTRMPAGPVI